MEARVLISGGHIPTLLDLHLSALVDMKGASRPQGKPDIKRVLPYRATKNPV